MSDRIGAELDRARERLRDEAPPRSPYLTVPEVAELARCEHRTVRRAVHAGVLPAFHPAQKLLIREADAIEWVESRPVRDASPPQRPRSTRRGPSPASVAELREMEREASS